MIEKNSTDGGWNETRLLPWNFWSFWGILQKWIQYSRWNGNPKPVSLPGSKKLSMIYPQQLRGTTGGAVAMLNIPLVIHLRSKTPWQIYSMYMCVLVDTKKHHSYACMHTILMLWHDVIMMFTLQRYWVELHLQHFPRVPPFLGCFPCTNLLYMRHLIHLRYPKTECPTSDT